MLKFDLDPTLILKEKYQGINGSYALVIKKDVWSKGGEETQQCM